jgi:hypothetical protein
VTEGVDELLCGLKAKEPIDARELPQPLDVHSRGCC